VTERELTFACMGTEVRLVCPDAAGLDDARAWLSACDARLSRFRSGSELAVLNRDPRRTVPASTLLRAAVGAAVWAARRTGGLVDPTVLDALRRAGYVRSLAGVVAPDVREAIAAAPPRAPAGPHPAARWRAIAVHDRAGTVVRPARLQLDLGGTGKGLAADAVAHRLGRRARFAVDCGGDLRAGGTEVDDHPFEVEVAHPFTGEAVHRLWLGRGAIATSGIDARVWRRPDGSFAHHLIDPATGEPAWTGLVSVTAFGPSALEAETTAKAALLSGPAAARELIRAHGGLLVHDDGDVELAGAPAGVLATA
jgi:thiamine biosynthesis lipoprotein